MLDSLVRVSRRVVEKHFVRVARADDRTRGLKQHLDLLPPPQASRTGQQVLFHSLFKVLFIFPSRYLFAIGLPSIFSFRWNLPPIRAAIPNNSTLRRDVLDSNPHHERGYHPPWRAISDNFDGIRILDVPFCRLHPRRFQPELFPLHSPLLGEYLIARYRTDWQAEQVERRRKLKYEDCNLDSFTYTTNRLHLNAGSANRSAPRQIDEGKALASLDGAGLSQTLQ
eukprot:2917082-Lingulodinium_polyedra.AAC.1